VAHLIGFGLPIVPDLEPILPGEGEIAAAKRLLQRLLVRYGRFFDAVVGDALYFEAPFMAFCRSHKIHLLAVVKNDNPGLLANIAGLTAGAPDLERDEKGRTVRYWDVEHLTTDSIDEPFRALRVEETWTERQRVAGRWVYEEQHSHWVWGTTIPSDLMPMRQIRRVGHERWKIENTVFNALSRDWALDHCFHHHPDAILNLLLILFLAHLFVACFHSRNIKEPRRRCLTLIAAATEILMGLAKLLAREVPWRALLKDPRQPARAAPASP
jgi:hypothetical protein